MNEMKSRLKLSLKKALVWVANIWLTMLFFFGLRALFLRCIGLRVGKRVAIHSRVKFFGFGNFSIGDRSTLNHGCLVDNRIGVYIGSNVNVSHDVKIYSMGHDVNDPWCKVSGGEVYLDDDVWVFPGVMIMPRVRISRGAVIYPGSIVTKDVPEFAIVAGNPAKIIGYRERDLRYRLDYRVWFAR